VQPLGDLKHKRHKDKSTITGTGMLSYHNCGDIQSYMNGSSEVQTIHSVVLNPSRRIWLPLPKDLHPDQQAKYANQPLAQFWIVMMRKLNGKKKQSGRG
jgi:hypothetical protein